jgi:AcrR family transcriptional regulator
LTPETLRADAARNRKKLLSAASELFVEAGTDVSLEAVAKRAGVGIGTLYRHFPTREALIEAAYRNEVALVSAAAEQLLAEHPPDIALAEWMNRYVAYMVAKRGMKDALHSVIASDSDLFTESRARLVAAISALLEAGAAAGSLRPDANAEDVLRAMGAVWNTTDEEQAQRVLGLLMDGLRYGT